MFIPEIGICCPAKAYGLVKYRSTISPRFAISVRSVISLPGWSSPRNWHGHWRSSCPNVNSSLSFHFCNLLLKQLKVLADTVSSSGLFHHVVILSLKKCCLKSVLNLTSLPAMSTSTRWFVQFVHSTWTDLTWTSRPSYTTRSLVTRVSVTTILRIDWPQRN